MLIKLLEYLTSLKHLAQNQIIEEGYGTIDAVVKEHPQGWLCSSPTGLLTVTIITEHIDHETDAVHVAEPGSDISIKICIETPKYQNMRNEIAEEPYEWDHISPIWIVSKGGMMLTPTT